MTEPDVTHDDDRWLARAVALAVRNVADGGGPFGAVVVRDGAEVATGVNRVTRDLDPTAHAEVMAIRAACRVLGTHSLAGTVLYSSCEPCPLCLTAGLWARVDRIVFAADRHDAAAAGFDDRAFYGLLEQDRDTWPNPVIARRIAVAGDPFTAWKAAEERTPY
ncbi:nucleoside deaminase [Myceligenerans pegani]|uniref:Nucleoside deaminase n=1 Tax=Myceligenerans pegani TaxID=2776917 RepID=A0ABR9N405_9MICO|nr:nucleoside deaminase [Myceligenerans sp. TRM 65318]MBE1877808.1 nucleoside deaminase [Myceligenerans sp. TRM 65318]MBE3020079.1 nucleoside deaminase [Myceligenerans sp. TRM 65318]